MLTIISKWLLGGNILTFSYQSLHCQTVRVLRQESQNLLIDISQSFLLFRGELIDSGRNQASLRLEMEILQFYGNAISYLFLLLSLQHLISTLSCWSAFISTKNLREQLTLSLPVNLRQPRKMTSFTVFQGMQLRRQQVGHQQQTSVAYFYHKQSVWHIFPHLQHIYQLQSPFFVQLCTLPQMQSYDFVFSCQMLTTLQLGVGQRIFLISSQNSAFSFIPILTSRATKNFYIIVRAAATGSSTFTRVLMFSRRYQPIWAYGHSKDEIMQASLSLVRLLTRSAMNFLLSQAILKALVIRRLNQAFVALFNCIQKVMILLNVQGLQLSLHYMKVSWSKISTFCLVLSISSQFYFFSMTTLQALVFI